MSEPSNVVRLIEHTYHDIPTVLRAIADDMENGVHGDVYDLVVVHRNSVEGLALHGGGGRATPERAHMLLCQAARWLEEQHS